MSMGGIGACGSHDLSKVLSALLARLDESNDETKTGAAETATAPKAEDCGKRWHRGETRLSSDILHVLLRLQQQEEQAAADDATTAQATASADTTAEDASEADRGSPIHRLFQAIDADADGTVTKEEFEAFIQAKGGTQEEADKLYALLDKDGDGALSEDQLVAAIKRGNRGHHYGWLARPNAERLFAKIDADGDGSLTKEEFEKFVTDRGGKAEKADRFFARLDKDEDGAVAQSELAQAIGHHRHSHRHGRPEADGENG